MLHSRGMFGMGIGEIVVIIVVALLFIGPEKLPEAAKSLSKGIRDIRKQTRELRETIEEDTEFGGAIRDLQSALRGEDHAASNAAQRRLAMQKAAALEPSAETVPAPVADGSIGELAGGTAAVAAGTAGTAGKDAGTTPAAADVPVIAASAGAVARGSTAGTPPAAPGADSAGSADEPAVNGPAAGRAHG